MVLAVNARALSWLTLALLASSCTSPMPDVDGLMDVVETHPDAPPIAPSTECTVTTGSATVTDRHHLEPCSPVEYTLNPPVGGPHYSIWASFGTYDAPVPWGFLVHSLEHGAVVLAYNCPNGCPDVLAAFERIRAATSDPACRETADLNRIIIVPDPDLDVPIAALAWEHAYLATCLDEPSLAAFVVAHYAHAPEELCVEGLSPADGVWCP